MLWFKSVVKFYFNLFMEMVMYNNEMNKGKSDLK